MVRVIGLALLFVVGAAVPAAADDTRKVSGIAGAVQQGAPTADETRRLGAEQRASVQSPGRTAMAQASLRRPVFSIPWLVVAGTAGVASPAPERRQPRPWTFLPWLSQGKSGLALSLTERLSLGVRYRHVEGEDLWREFADVGSMDYESHNILLRAHWRF